MVHATHVWMRMLMSSLGFTGTQDGMTEVQRNEVERLLKELDPRHVHHGDCVGADQEFHSMCEGRIRHIHPSNLGHKRAWCEGDIVYRPNPPLKRNRHIVNMSDELIAAPYQYLEVMRSGTWATIRYAKQKGIKIHIVYPDGKVEIVADRTNVVSKGDT